MNFIFWAIKTGEGSKGGGVTHGGAGGIVGVENVYQSSQFILDDIEDGIYSKFVVAV